MPCADVMAFYVLILRVGDDHEVNRMGPYDTRVRAERVERSVGVNLDFERFYTQIEEA